MSYTAIDNSQSVIQHYGKKGMKWGVRSRHADLKANHASYKKVEKTSQRYHQRSC